MPASSSKTVPIHLLSGSDEDAVKKAAADLSAKLAPDDAMNFETIDGRALTVDEAVGSIGKVREAILTLPFFGGGKLVWWKGVNFFDESGVGRLASVKEALETLLPDLDKVDGTSVTLLISASGLHKGRAFSKALLKIAQAKYFDLPDLRNTSEDEIIFQIERRMTAAGLRPGQGAAERFFEATGLDTSQWSQEMEKLALYAGDSGQELTRDDVNQVISGSREVLIWDFCAAVLGGDAKLALAQLSALLAQDESEVGILILLAGQVRLAALAAVLSENRMLRIKGGRFASAEVSPEGTAYLLRKKSGEPISTYSLGQAAQRSQRKPARFWFAALGAIYRTQREMLTGESDKRRALELVVLEIVSGEL
ncbi:MAG TPA: DNA polymerase III subunit delta [Candidatus Methylacidiphilales bacterium]|jgi:DNA polymerase-3 subunit delta|nr:DNA polymerase III subunit delta [Candidatus Methylacidiphilales bacterium]